MINCPKCKAAIDSDSHYCDQCGQELLFCVRCHRPGKGNRCTFCGGRMARAGEETDDAADDATRHVTIRETTPALAQGVTGRGGIPQMVMANDSLSLRLVAQDGAVIGRSQGPYKAHLAKCGYISAAHARLNYVPGQGWCVTDTHSSNGTSVNRRRLMPDLPSMLRSGDRLLLANVEFRIEIG